MLLLLLLQTYDEPPHKRFLSRWAKATVTNETQQRLHDVVVAQKLTLRRTLSGSFASENSTVLQEPFITSSKRVNIEARNRIRMSNLPPRPRATQGSCVPGHHILPPLQLPVNVTPWFDYLRLSTSITTCIRLLSAVVELFLQFLNHCWKPCRNCQNAKGSQLTSSWSELLFA